MLQPEENTPRIDRHDAIVCRRVGFDERLAGNRDIWNQEKETLTVFGAKESHVSAHDVTPEERERVFEESWADGGGFRFMFGTFNDLITDEGANKYAQEFIRSKIRQVVKDPAKAEKLIPQDLYAKRPLCDAGYYQQFNRANVDVVDIKANPIARLAGNSVILEGGETYELDMLILATGFDAGDGNYMRLKLEGVDGISIQDQWKDGARSYLGLMNAKFPNLFMVNGPGVPFANQPPAIELQVDMIAELVEQTLDRNAAAIEAKQSAEDGYVDLCCAGGPGWSIRRRAAGSTASAFPPGRNGFAPVWWQSTPRSTGSWRKSQAIRPVDPW